MITIEVKDERGKILEHRTFSLYSMALEWFERLRELYGQGISIRFGSDAATIQN